MKIIECDELGQGKTINIGDYIIVGTKEVKTTEQRETMLAV